MTVPMAWTLFYDPVVLPYYSQVWLILPLCVVVATVYKTIRTKRLNRLFLEVVASMGYMLAGLVALGAALWLLRLYWS